MFQSIRKRFNATTLVATLALVFAMTGGAYAASKYLITSTKQISPKVLKSLKGASGKNGAAGPQGPQGPQGSVGAAGIKGETGPPGINGTSVTSKEVKTGEAACNKEGGSEFSSASGKTYTCNGTTGFTETLPKGKTLKGDWSIAEVVSSEAPVATSVSFGIPLAEAPTPIYVKAGEETPAHCSGDAQEPAAERGYLCVFATKEQDSNTTIELFDHTYPVVCSVASGSAVCLAAGEDTADPFGFGVLAVAEAAGLVNISGSWAVTAE